MNFPKVIVTAFFGVTLVGCAVQSAKEIKPIITDGNGDKVYPVTVKKTKREALRECVNTQRNLKIEWGGRTYWCGPVRRHSEISNVNKRNHGSKYSSPIAKSELDVAQPKKPISIVLKREAENKPATPIRKIKTTFVAPVNEVAPVKKKPLFNYSVAYVYDARQPWNEMWSSLEGVPIPDKWKGWNSKTNKYFIYAGVYHRMKHAEARRRSLEEHTGESPLIKKRERS